MPRTKFMKSALSNQSRIASLSKKVNKNTKILNQREVGRLRFDMDATPDTTAVIQNVSQVGQGDDVTQRHGRKVHAVSLSVSGSVEKNTSSSETIMRLFIFRDNLGTTTAPTIGDVFSDVNDFVDNKHRLINEQPMKRFTVLWDRLIILNENFDGQTTTKAFKFFKKLNFNITYSGPANTDEGKNSIWFMSASNEATNVPAMRGDIVFRFTDL